MERAPDDVRDPCMLRGQCTFLDCLIAAIQKPHTLRIAMVQIAGRLVLEICLGQSEAIRPGQRINCPWCLSSCCTLNLQSFRLYYSLGFHEHFHSVLHSPHFTYGAIDYILYVIQEASTKVRGWSSSTKQPMMSYKYILFTLNKLCFRQWERLFLEICLGQS